MSAFQGFPGRRRFLALPLLLLPPLVGCPDSPEGAREETTIEWDREMYEAGEGEEFTAILTLTNPFGLGNYGTYVTSSDISVLEVLSGMPPHGNPEGDLSHRQVPNTDGPQDIHLRCAGAGMATLTAVHRGSDGYGVADLQIEDEATVLCNAAGTSTTTGTSSGSSGDTMTTTGDGTTGGSTTSTDGGSTGDPPSACASGEAMAPNSADITVSGVDISGEISGNPDDCPVLLCSFSVTNGTDDYVTFGVLESVPDDPISPVPIVSAVAAGATEEFEVWANDCTTPIALDRTLFVHDEVNGINLGEVDLLWETSLP